MSEKIDGCPYCYIAPQEQRRLLLTQGTWLVFLAERQDYIGHCVLVHREHLDRLSDTTVQDFMDLMMVVRLLEKAAESVFDATNFNWSCLMNDAFKETEFNPHLHLHFRPRYQDAVKVLDNSYVDGEFSHHYDPHKPDQLNEAEKEEVFRRLYAYLHA
ncbi:MAG: HIT family protein [Eubacterium sp.]|nr:HIT family protein [Eubacterium sp.]